MGEKLFFTDKERKDTYNAIRTLHGKIGHLLHEDDESKVFKYLRHALSCQVVQRDMFGMNPLLLSLQTAQIAVDEIGLKRDGVMAILLYTGLPCYGEAPYNVAEDFGENVARIIHGLQRIQELYKKNPIVESENFRNLLLSFAEDMRVILIMIADRVNLMRQIRDTDRMEAKMKVSEEASYLYAPLAHKLGLYKLKSELEDLSLKYLEHDAYYMIKEKLSATKQHRDAYIERFIGPIDAKLKEAGLKYHIKGRTKSIHSIWQKMKKQQCGFEGIYDLFAIRIILDSPVDLEKVQCWQVFALITNMYQPNVCATGSACPNQMAMRVFTSPCSDPKASGWRCRYAPNAWTRWPSVAWLHTGDTRASRARVVSTNGSTAYVPHWKTRTTCR